MARRAGPNEHDAPASLRDKGGVASVIKALSIIEYVGEHGPASLSVLVSTFQLPKSTLFRLLGTICDAGFLRRTARGEYATTIKLWRIGVSAIDQAMHMEVEAALRRLVEDTKETAHFSIYDDGEAVYVEKVEGLHPIRAYTYVGGRSPAYASATGKALLAFQTADEIARVAKQVKRHTPTTLQSEFAVIAEMKHIRELGYAVNRGEWRDHVWGVSAPVFDRYQEVKGAIGLSGPQDRIEPSLHVISTLVSDAARLLSEQLGGRPAHEMSRLSQ